MPETDKYCWICHREHASLPCKVCFRNYHYRCARNIMADDSLFVPDSNNRRLYQFSTSCSECQMLAKAAKNWDKGLEFQKISKKTLNTLLSYILDLLKQSAPAPLLWPASKLSISGCPFTMDFHKIKHKASDNLYNSPREFLNDITLINHNCAIIVKCENRNREMRALSKELYSFKNEMIEFKKTAEARIRYLEDCPHCILNFSNCGDKWLTMTCPWGHLLILAKIDDSLWPAKLIRYNRASGRLDVILFGTGERTRISESQCWIPSRSDLDIPQKKEDLIVAYDQAIKYANTLRKKFGRKFCLPGLSNQLVNTNNQPTTTMKVIALFALIGLATAGYAPANLANTGSSVSTRTQDSVGNYAFAYQENHATGGTSRKEQGNAYGQVVGSYSLGVIDGRQRIVNYVADPVHGFRAQVITNEPGTAPTTQTVAKVAAPVVAAPQYAAPAPVVAAPAYAAPQYAAPAQLVAAPSYAAPVVTKVAAPAFAYSAPAPVVAKVAAPAYAYSAPAYAYSAPAPVVTKVAAPAYAYSAPAFTYSAPAPVVAKVAAPAYAYSAPAFAYSAPAPVVTKVAAPAYTYSAPIVHKVAQAPIVQQAW